MKSAFRVSVIPVVLLTFICSSFAQQSDSSKPAAAKKPAAAQPAEKAAESAKKPDAAEEPQPAIREASGDKDRDRDRDRDKEERYDMTEMPPVVTHHQITVEGKALKYTATAGRLPIKRGDGKIEAEMFYVAYTVDGQDAAKRPLTFAFNGGPGSASIWLHASGSVSHRRQSLHAARQERSRADRRDRYGIQPGC
jgi:carboxypeptidase C (cathepsin A)